jgi:polyphosphate kinase 2 (PPK2 family)
MGFCTDEQYERFLKVTPGFEKQLTDSGIILIKLWLEVGNKEQERRFKARIDDPLRQWKLSPMDLPSRARWYEYSRARDAMFKATDTRNRSWHIVRSDHAACAAQRDRPRAEDDPTRGSNARR